MAEKSSSTDSNPISFLSISQGSSLASLSPRSRSNLQSVILVGEGCTKISLKRGDSSSYIINHNHRWSEQAYPLPIEAFIFKLAFLISVFMTISHLVYCSMIWLRFKLIMQSTGTKISLDQDLIKNQISPTAFLKRAHGNSIQSLAVHPNQKTFATGSHDKTIKLWDAATLKETVTLADHKQGVWTLDYSPDGNMLVSGGPDASVLIWDSKKSSPGVKIQAHKSKVYCARFNQNGKLLGTCGETGEIFIWDVAKTKEPLKRIDAGSLIAYDLEWSQNEQLFFVTTLGSQLQAYNSKTFAPVASHQVTENQHDSKCESVAANFKLIDKRVFVGTSRGKIAWYEAKENTLVKETEFLAHLDSVRTINYHPSRKILLSTGRDGSARLWNAESNTHHPTILGNLALHVENIPAAGFLGSETVVTGSWDQQLAIWNVSSLLK